MKATSLALLPLAFAIVSCTQSNNAGQAVPPQQAGTQPYGAPQANPYGIPGQNEVGQYTPDATPYQPVDPINPPVAGTPSAVSGPPPLNTIPSAGTPTAPRPAIGGTSYTVVPGDSLWGISRRYGVSVDAIRQANGMAAGDSMIRSGQTLQIPGR